MSRLCGGGIVGSRIPSFVLLRCVHPWRHVHTLPSSPCCHVFAYRAVLIALWMAVRLSQLFTPQWITTHGGVMRAYPSVLASGARSGSPRSQRGSAGAACSMPSGRPFFSEKCRVTEQLLQCFSYDWCPLLVVSCQGGAARVATILLLQEIGRQDTLSGQKWDRRR